MDHDLPDEIDYLPGLGFAARGFRAPRIRASVCGGGVTLAIDCERNDEVWATVTLTEAALRQLLWRLEMDAGGKGKA